MVFKENPHWQTTVTGLHKGAQLLGAVQRLTQDPLPAYLELGLDLTATGLTSSELPGGVRVALDFTAGSLMIKTPQGTGTTISLSGASQAEAFAALFETLSESALAGVIPEGGTLFERVSTGITERGGRYQAPQKSQLANETPIVINSQAAGQYLDAVQNAFDGLARLRARLLGLMTPLVVWPEHFDLSMLWFTGSEIDENRPHLNFGFAPYSSGLEFPYLYAYAYPYPNQYQPPDLPDGAHWHTEGWTGMVLPYDSVAQAAHPDVQIEADMSLIYRGLLKLLTE